MPPISEPALAPSELDIVITHTFEAPRHLVWEMFMEPEHLARWWGPRGFDTRVERHEPTEGGRTRYVMVGPDGAEYPVEGAFLEIDAPRRFVSTDEFGEDYEGETVGGMILTATFDDQGSRTLLTLRITHRTLEEKRKHEEMGVVGGWKSSLDCLEEEIVRSFGPENADREIVVMRTLGAPRDLVWAAWTDPERVTRWWGPEGFSTTTSEMDVSPGGLWKFTMHGPDGRDYRNCIEFLEVREGDRLVYRHRGEEPDAEGVGFRSVITFAAVEGDDSGGRTRITMRMEFDSAEELQRVEERYGAIRGALDTVGRLDRHVRSEAGRQGESLTVAYPSATETILQRVLHAPRELVFEAFSKPEHICRWWGPRRMRMVECEMDFRPGGSWRFVQETPDGHRYAFRGEYREILPPERLVHTFIFDMEGAPVSEAVETVVLETRGDITVLTNTIRHAPTGACARDTGMEGGASESFDRLEELAAAMADDID